MLSVKDISKSFEQLRVLNQVSFDLKDGEVVGLIGPSGSGKSVLMKILGGVLASDRGQIDNGGIDVNQTSLMFQEGALFDSLHVFDNVAFPLVGGKVPTAILSRKKRMMLYGKVMGILSRVGLSDAAYKVPAQLSGGMRRRVSLARALVSRPKLALLDDPTCGLDPVASSVIMNLILELHHEYKPTTVMVSHDLRRLLPVVDKIIALFDGQIVFSGTLDQMRALTGADLYSFVSCRYDFDQAA